MVDADSGGNGSGGGVVHRVPVTYGQVQTWVQRIGAYTGPLSQIMVFYLFVRSEPLSLPWTVWFIAVVGILCPLLWFDVRTVLPQALGYGWMKNPEWMEFKNKFEEMYNWYKKRN